MPNTREKLIELIRMPIKIMQDAVVSPHITFTLPYAEDLADRLIANGVTILTEPECKLKPEIIGDRFVRHGTGVWYHQFRMKLGDGDWMVSKALPEDLVKSCIQEQKWISVTERLPEDDLPKDTKKKMIRCLVYSDKGTIKPCVRQRWEHFDGQLVPWQWNKDLFAKPTHWMYYPQPPKGE